MQPSDLESTVNRQSWEWLFDLPRRLNIVIEVIDDRHMPVFPVGASPVAVTVRQMLTTGDPALVAAISNALRSIKPTPVGVDGLQAVCFGLSQAGVLVLARELADGTSAAESRQELESIGSWLTTAIDASLTKPPHAISPEPYRIASLQRILSDATSRGSVRRVVGAFVEALGVWDDVTIFGYAPAANGGLFQYVSPVGPPSSFPAELDDAIVPRHGRMMRLSRVEIERLGLPAEADEVLILRLEETGCLLLFSGAIDDHEQVRLTLYSDMLRESLNDVLTATTGGLIAEMTRDQLSPDEPIEDSAQAALSRLTVAVGGSEAALSVTSATGGPGLTVGDTDLLSALNHQASPDRLVVISSDDGGAMTIVMAREQHRFTSFERAIVESGATALHSWLQAALEPAKESERRRRFRPVDTLFDQIAADAVDAGQQVSVIVVAVNQGALRPGLVQTWLGKTRAQLRAGDFAGVLSDTEIAVLLCDASPDHATVVSARLKELIESHDSPGALFQPAFGMTTRSPASPFEGSLVGAARAGAAAVR